MPNIMKPFKLLYLAVLCLLAGPLLAQSENYETFRVHEDVVKPSKVSDYEAVAKEFLGNLKKYNIQDMNFIVTNTDDNRYLYVSPLENMAELDNPLFRTLSEKMGKDALAALFQKMDKCYDTEQDYILHLDKELTYMPSGITQTPEGRDYRKFHYLWVSPSNRDVVREKMKAVTELFASKGSKEYYRVYRSGFGVRGEYYMVAVAAKDELESAQLSMDNSELLGDEGKKAFDALFSSLLKYEQVSGRMRPDLYYQPAN